VSVDAKPEQDSGVALLLQPRVGWPKQMTVGRPHVVAVDLALVTQDGAQAPWQLPQEEITYTFELEGGADFDQWAVHDPAVVLHRFGGSYGPAEFVVTPRKDGEHSLWLTIINPGGITVGDHELKVTVIPDGLPAEPSTRTDVPIPTRTDVPIPMRRDVPAATRKDLAYAEKGYADTEEFLVGLGSAPADIEPYSGSAAPAAPGEEPPATRLAEWYNVMGLRRSPSGNLHLGLLPLFAPGTPSGERVSFTARCAPTDEHGTVFAVVAELPNGERRRRQLRSVQSARVPPGVYQVTAELLYPYPGHVRFYGLPTMPRDDPRRWSSIMAAVPHRLGDGAGPAHLIAAIEISGSPELVAERIDCARRLVIHVADQAHVPVSYSVITYGPHSINVHNRDYPEIPVITLAWADTSDVAIDALARLGRRPVVTSGYTAAAQVECVLAELDGRLTGAEGRPVIVTAGGRPAHPPTVDAAGLIPCIYRNDWRRYIDRLARHAGIAYGAIHDNGFPNDLWRFLGNDIGAAIDDFSAPEFALALGLTAGYAQFLPLPLINGLTVVGSTA
jgi:hypothetical protein